MRPLALLLTACAAALLAAGCGAPSEHSVDKTKACLQTTGARITPPRGDFVASTATVGAFRAYLRGGTNFVTMSFGADEKEAADTARGYDRFHGKNVGLADILFVDKNVVMLWKQHPSDAETKSVIDCLK